jgi:hypothetical protein
VDRKKELKLQYKQMKPQMGVFMFRSKASHKCYLEATQDLKGTINSTKFKLGAGIHPNRELQREWQDFREDNFIIEILEELQYDKDETKTDYREDLAVLEMMWEEKLIGQKLEISKMRRKK